MILSALLKPFKKNDSKVETSLIEEFYYPKLGPGQLWERMSEICVEKGADLRKNQKVVKINLDGNRVKSVIVENTDETSIDYKKTEEIFCDYLVSSMPINELSESIAEFPQEEKEIAKEKGRRAESSQIFRTCALTFGAIGFICSLIMFIGADYICEITAHPGAELPMRVISPTLFIICITASIRGYFQGLRKMVPTAVSNFIEAVLKLILGLGGAAFAASRGWSGPVQAAFAVSGISIGVIIGTVYLAITFYLQRNANIPDTDKTVSPRSVIAKNALRVAVPVTLAGSALYFSTFFDTVVINNRLIFSGFSEILIFGTTSPSSSFATSL